MRLRTRDLHSGYGRLTVLHGVDLEVDAGQMVAVLGPNGAGKTTLLRTCVGLLGARRGELLIDDVPVKGRHWNASRAAAMGVAYVPQSGNVFPDLSVAENLELSRLNARSSADLVDHVYDRFPVLADRSNQLAGSLSGGERQSLAVSMAFAASPRLLLLDEPTTGLSPMASQALLDWIVEMTSFGTGVVWVVEQNPQPVLEHAQHAYVLDGGRVVASGDANRFSDGQAMALVFKGDRQEPVSSTRSD